MTDQRIYLDYNATTPVDPLVLETMLPYFSEVFGNAASNDHDFGIEAKRAVDSARTEIARTINARPDEIIFTSGATESDNIALFGAAEKYAHKGDHIITTVVEHKAVLDCCARVEQQGKRVTYLPVDRQVRIDPDDVRAAITPQTVLISVMAANNEVGTLQPLAEIGAIAMEHGVLFHSDAAQALGHVPLDVQAANIHILSLSAHKVYGPKGIGALYRRRSNPRVRLAPVICGGGHERGLRSGTLNVPAIVGFGAAVKLARRRMDADAAQYRQWTAQMLAHLQAELGAELNGHPSERLAHNLNVYLPGVKARALIVQLQDVALATGSACTSAEVEPSHVILGMGYDETRAHGSIRISVGRLLTEEAVKLATERIVRAARSLQEMRLAATA